MRLTKSLYVLNVSQIRQQKFKTEVSVVPPTENMSSKI